MWIYLIRHAETDGNLQRIVQLPNTPLSIRGKQQAKQLALAYGKLPISKVICSDYARTQSTARVLSEQLKCPLILSELLRERHFGELRGMAYDDIDSDFFAPNYQPLGGESYAQFVERVQSAWQHFTEIANTQNDSLALVSHGLVIRCIMTEILKLPTTLLEQTDIKNTSVIKISKHDFSNIPMLCDLGHLSDDLVHG